MRDEREMGGETQPKLTLRQRRGRLCPRILHRPNIEPMSVSMPMCVGMGVRGVMRGEVDESMGPWSMRTAYTAHTPDTAVTLRCAVA